MSLWPQHDAEGYFVGESDDSGSGIQPGNTAEQDDWPEVMYGYIPRRNRIGSEPPFQWLPGWEQVENHTGREGWLDGQQHTVKGYGPPPPGWTPEPPAPEPLTLEEANTRKYAEIIAGANAMDAAIKARYSQPEITSFDVQRQGAEAILADPAVEGPPNSPVALVRGLAATEGVTSTDFAARILDNVALASAATEAILLQQRAYEAALKKAADPDEVAAIVVEYRLG